MSTEVGAFDAKTHLSEYLDRASRGESFTITRRGVPLAELRPVSGGESALAELIDQCTDLRQRIAGRGVTFDAAAAVREDRER